MSTRIDFLSPKGVAWSLVGESLKENGTIESIERLLQAAKASDVPVRQPSLSQATYGARRTP